LFDSLLQEDIRKREEKDERKRKYNVRWEDEVFLSFYFGVPLKNWNSTLIFCGLCVDTITCYLQVTAEEMEAYRMKKVHHDDPMKAFLS